MKIVPNGMRVVKIFPVFSFCMLCALAVAQEGTTVNHIYDGNKEVESEAYIEAEIEYRKALSAAPEETTALYNLGNTHYRSEQLDEASQRYFQAQKFASEKEERHKAFHNLGNVYMQKKEYEKAVAAYENALRNNPQDEETRYNYALAKEFLEKEKQQQDQNEDQGDDQNQKDKNQQDKNQNKGEGDSDEKDENSENEKNEGDDGDEKKDGDEGDEKEDENKDPEQEKEKPGKPRERPGQLSPQQIKSLLEAMNNQEKKVQEKINAKKVEGKPVKTRKDW